MFQLPLNITLDSSATLDSFFVGLNDELIAKIQAYSNDQFYYNNTSHINETSINENNMLFIWGAEDSGKSHLAQATCQMFDKIADKTCVFLPLNNKEISHHILEGLENIDLVCIDSLEFVRGDLEWQVSLFNLYNDLKDANKKLIIFSKQSPSQIQLELTDLLSRLNSMPIYKLHKIDEQQLVEFVQASGKNIGMEINVEVANFLLSRSDRSVINLKNIISKLDEQSLAHQRRITIPFIKDILEI